MKVPGFIILAVLLASCASAGPGNAPEIPAEPARHRAALATVIVSNSTLAPLIIAYRSAAPPVKEVIIGRVAGGQKIRLAPIPAAEPIVMVARRADGSELALAPRSFEVDAEWTWEIPHDATFKTPQAR